MGNQWIRSTGVFLALGWTKCVSKTKHHYHVFIRNQRKTKNICIVVHINSFKTDLSALKYLDDLSHKYGDQFTHNDVDHMCK